MFCLLLFAGEAALAVPTLLGGVPSYTWTYGCSPTAGGQLFGYWDGNGYSNLFSASGADVFQTPNVEDEIASPGHIADYWGDPDPLAAGHTDDSIADFMGTNRGTLPNGGTWLSNIPNGMEDYASFRGYNDWGATNLYFSTGAFTWSTLIAEIDAGRPLLLSVDSSGDGTIDHSITGIGYEDRGVDGLWYACFNTWHEAETVDWYQFRGVSSNYAWGVYNATLVMPGLSDGHVVPLPGAFVLGLMGTMFCVASRRRSSRREGGK